MKTIAITFIVLLTAMVLTISAQNIMGQRALALKNFFACITDISSKDGGDHNLTAQQVLDCFKKEFPSNDQSIGHSSSTTDVIVNGHHFHSQIIN